MAFMLRERLYRTCTAEANRLDSAPAGEFASSEEGFLCLIASRRFPVSFWRARWGYFHLTFTALPAGGSVTVYVKRPLIV